MLPAPSLAAIQETFTDILLYLKMWLKCWHKVAVWLDLAACYNIITSLAS